MSAPPRERIIVVVVALHEDQQVRVDPRMALQQRVGSRLPVVGEAAAAGVTAQQALACGSDAQFHAVDVVLPL
jgi:hypothetical protein